MPERRGKQPEMRCKDREMRAESRADQMVQLKGEGGEEEGKLVILGKRGRLYLPCHTDCTHLTVVQMDFNVISRVPYCAGPFFLRTSSIDALDVREMSSSTVPCLPNDQTKISFLETAEGEFRQEFLRGEEFKVAQNYDSKVSQWRADLFFVDRRSLFLVANRGGPKGHPN